MGVMSWLMGMGCEELSAQEIKAMKQSGEKFVLVDVRTPEEHSRRKIEGSRLIPLQEMERRAGEIPKDKEVVSARPRSCFAASWQPAGTTSRSRSRTTAA